RRGAEESEYELAALVEKYNSAFQKLFALMFQKIGDHAYDFIDRVAIHLSPETMPYLSGMNLVANEARIDFDQLLNNLIASGSRIEFMSKTYGKSVWETRIVFQWGRVRPEIERVSMVGDAWHYREIAEHGYDRSSRDAFFPLFPLLARALGSDFPLSGLILS